MKFHLGILFLFAYLLALPMEAVQACGESGGNQNSAASLQSDDEHCSIAGDECVETHPGQDCPPDTDGCGKCHCPGCGATGTTFAGFFKHDLIELTAPDWSHPERIANFCYRTPSSAAHLAALFQPPRV